MEAGSTPSVGCVFIMEYDSKFGIYEVVENTSETLDPKCHRCGLNHKCTSGRRNTVPECTKNKRTDGKSVYFKRIDTHIRKIRTKQDPPDSDWYKTI